MLCECQDLFYVLYWILGTLLCLSKSDLSQLTGINKLARKTTWEVRTAFRLVSDGISDVFVTIVD